MELPGPQTEPANRVPSPGRDKNEEGTKLPHGASTQGHRTGRSNVTDSIIYEAQPIPPEDPNDAGRKRWSAILGAVFLRRYGGDASLASTILLVVTLISAGTILGVFWLIG